MSPSGRILACLLAPVAWACAADSFEVPSACRNPVYCRESGRFEVESQLADWTDDARNRTLPVKIYRPKGVSEPLPAILFSHGLGGSREAAEYAGRFWASFGYLSVHVQHPGTDASAWRGETSREGVMEALQGSLTWRNIDARYRDVGFVVEQLRQGVAGRVDPRRIGIAGHSMGAHTVLAAVGQRPGGIRRLSYKVDGLAAAVAMSPSPPQNAGAGRLEAVYADIEAPILHLTGTEDDSPLQKDLRPADRQKPFHDIPSHPQYLLVFEGGDHMLFSGRTPGLRENPLYARDHGWICAVTTAFFDATLRGDAQAKAWLDGLRAEDFGGDAAVYETK
ncbi:MAG: acetylhydrolase [Acidobacteria bacterium]|nr:acetylhydrolase [Acidobacteriota bacterium]